MEVQVNVESPIYSSFRVQQVAGLFDVPLTEKVRQTFRAEIPDLSEPWSIGAIVGPSGSGKTTIARQAFGDCLYTDGQWPADKAVVDCFGDLSIKQITQTLTAVGFSSPPSWVKPYHVLSNGEKFRCNLARALLSGNKVIAFDEFSSVVDRTVAKVGSAAIAKSIRGGRLDARFIAVTCHYDIVEWLQPDWVLDMATGTLVRGSVQRPQIRLEVFRCERAAWKLFSRHHYLSSSLHHASQCYIALWDGEPVAFIACLANFGHANRWRISRVVVLPDYQGIGIGVRFCETVAQIWVDSGKRMSITASHPAIIRHMEKSALWRLMRVNKTGNHEQARARQIGQPRQGSTGRAVVAFEYVGSRNGRKAR